MNDVMKLIELSDERLEKAKLYHQNIIKAKKAEMNLKLILASKYLKGFRATKKNLGIEMALMMMMEQDNPDAKEIEGYFSDFVLADAEAKGLEKILEAMDSKVSLGKSILFWEEKGEKR